MEIKNLINSLKLLNSKNLKITDYFINVLDHKFNTELLDNEKIKSLNINKINHNINKGLNEFYHIFSNDYILFTLLENNNLNISSIITTDYNKFNTFEKLYDINNCETIDNRKSIIIYTQIINIYYTQEFNYLFYKQITNTSLNQFILYNQQIFIYPLNFYKLFKTNKIEEVEFNNNDDFNTMIDNIISRKDKLNLSIIKDKEKQNKLLEYYFFISISMFKNKNIETVIKVSNQEFVNYLIEKYIFYIIKIKNIEVLDQLLKVYNQENKISFLNKNGLNPFEYSLFKFVKDSSYYPFVSLLNKYNFTRPKYIFDIILKTNIIKHDIISNYDQIIFNKISKISNYENIEIINTIIIDSYYKDLNSENNTITINDIIYFIKENIQFIDLNILFNLIFKYSSVLIIKELVKNKIIEFSKDVLLLFINLKQTDYLIKNYYKETLNCSKDIIYQLINELNVYGLIFIIEFVNKDIIDLKDDENNNLLHYLTNQTIQKDNENYENLEFNVFKLLVNKKKDLITELNNNNETPIFNTIKQNNFYLFNLLLDMDDTTIDIKNKNGDYLIHSLINCNFTEAINYYILKSYDLELRDINDNTALLLAIKNKQQNIANDLIINNADIEVVDNKNNSIFYYIALYNLNNIEINKKCKLQNDKKIIDGVKTNIFYQFKKLNFMY